MTRSAFEKLLEENSRLISTIRERAHRAHHLVNQHYDRTHPYGLHLDMVARFVMQYGHHVLDCSEEFPALIFGAYFHDAIEDARLSYNDMLRLAED
ncbi:MAG: SS18 family protein, partial [Muribaculaceae bacterium]|nr:SS18 family protein [Muribaculaceae bacterium]